MWTARQHDLRLQYLESPLRARILFCRQRPPKATFITEFIGELRSHTPAVVEAQVAELEGLLQEEEGGGAYGRFSLQVVRSMSCRTHLSAFNWVSRLRVGSLLWLTAQSLREPLVLHQERPRVRHAHGKGKGEPKGKSKGQKGEGKGGKVGKAAAKAAAIPLIPRAEM